MVVSLESIVLTSGCLFGAISGDVTDFMAGEALPFLHMVISFLFIKCGKPEVGVSRGFVHGSGSKWGSVVAGSELLFKVHDPVAIMLGGVFVPCLDSSRVGYDIEFDSVA